jgi:Na+-transporting NADH:ubiquinone oxidoreductase subunit F
MREAFYVEEYGQLPAESPGCKWHLVSSDPLPEDDWTGFRGFIRNMLYENYLKGQKTPEECVFYICAARP